MSKFLKVKCACGNEQVVFGNASSKLNCLVCNAELASATGSRIKVNEGVKIIKYL